MPNISVITPTFLISDWKKIKFFKTLLNNKKSINFSHIKFLLILFFAQKLMEFWLFFLSSKSSGVLKKDPTFGFLTFGYALKKWALGRACMEKVSCIYCTHTFTIFVDLFLFLYSTVCPTVWPGSLMSAAADKLI